MSAGNGTIAAGRGTGLPPGPQKIAIGLWDATAQAGSFISSELEVGS